MLSAAILVSGGTVGKFFIVLSYMNVACIIEQTFYTHLKYLQLAVKSCWNAQQTEFVNQCRATGTAVTIGAW